MRFKYCSVKERYLWSWWGTTPHLWGGTQSTYLKVMCSQMESASTIPNMITPKNISVNITIILLLWLICNRDVNTHPLIKTYSLVKSTKSRFIISLYGLENSLGEFGFYKFWSTFQPCNLHWDWKNRLHRKLSTWFSPGCWDSDWK